MEYKYQHIDASNNKHYLIFSINKNKIQGLYWGAEINLDKTIIYYKSQLKDGNINRDSLYFVLNDFEYSNTKIGPHFLTIDPVSNIDKIPFILKGNLYFAGLMTKDTIEFKRTSDLYDSKFDTIIFSKYE